MLASLGFAVAGISFALLVARMPDAFIRELLLWGAIATLLAAVVIFAVSFRDDALQWSSALTASAVWTGVAVAYARQLNAPALFHRRLKRARSRPRALRELERRLAWIEGHSRINEHAGEANTLAAALIVVDQPQRAAALLEQLDPTVLADDNAPLTYNNIIVAHIESGDSGAAYDVAVDVDVAQLRPSRLRDLLSTSVALAFAIAFEHEHAANALALVSSGALTADVDRSRRIAAVHLCALEGDDVRARDLLNRIANGPAGHDLIETIARHDGPASPAARRMLEERGIPYR